MFLVHVIEIITQLQKYAIFDINLLNSFILELRKLSPRRGFSLPNPCPRALEAISVFCHGSPCVVWRKRESRRESGAGPWGQLIICLLRTELGAAAFFASADVSFSQVMRRGAGAVSSICSLKSCDMVLCKTNPDKGRDANKQSHHTQSTVFQGDTDSVSPPPGVKECHLLNVG